MNNYKIKKRKQQLKGQIDFAEKQLKSNLVVTFDQSPSLKDAKNLVPIGIRLLPLLPLLIPKFQSSEKKQKDKRHGIPWMQISTMLLQMFLKFKNEKQSNGNT